jgi:L-aminoadipate-semialdehyde dehydrogenase
MEYGKDLNALISQLHPSYNPLPTDFATKLLTVCLTGVTGYLGVFILQNLLHRCTWVAKVLLSRHLSHSRL